jgi:hypothetical protein
MPFSLHYLYSLYSPGTDHTENTALPSNVAAVLLLRFVDSWLWNRIYWPLSSNGLLLLNYFAS